MKKIGIVVLYYPILIVACNSAKKDTNKENKIAENATYSSFGATISELRIIYPLMMLCQIIKH